MASWTPIWNPTKTTAATKKSSFAVDAGSADFFGRTPQAIEAINPISLPKIPGADPYIKGLFDDLTKLKSGVDADLTKYRDSWSGSQPMAENYAKGDIAELDRILNSTGYEADLGQVRREKQTTLAGLNDAILGDLRRTLNLSARGGTAGTGLGSYLTRQAGSQAGRIRADAATSDADQARSDLLTLMQARGTTAGKRSTIMDALLSRLLSPTEKSLAANSGYAAQLQQALNSALANLTSGYAMNAYA